MNDCNYNTKVIDVSSVFPYKKNPFALSLDNVFSIQECNDLIQRTETLGYGQALVGKNQVRVESQRNNSRLLLDDPILADEIFQRIKDHIPTEWLNCPVSRLNERLRFLKYEPGQYFKPHNDGVYITDDKSECSFVTIHLYLNEDYTGGETTFTNERKSYGFHLKKNFRQDPNDIKRVPFKGKTGQVLIFEHHLGHEGSLLVSGTKYTMRSDILYHCKGRKENVRTSRWELDGPNPQYKRNNCECT